MIKITNSTETKTVTKGAYENFYKPLGFTVVNDGKPITKAEVKEIKKDFDNENKEIKESLEDNGKQSYKRK